MHATPVGRPGCCVQVAPSTWMNKHFGMQPFEVLPGSSRERNLHGWCVLLFLYIFGLVSSHSVGFSPVSYPHLRVLHQVPIRSSTCLASISPLLFVDVTVVPHVGHWWRCARCTSPCRTVKIFSQCPCTRILPLRTVEKIVRSHHGHLYCSCGWALPVSLRALVSSAGLFRLRFFFSLGVAMHGGCATALLLAFASPWLGCAGSCWTEGAGFAPHVVEVGSDATRLRAISCLRARMSFKICSRTAARRRVSLAAFLRPMAFMSCCRRQALHFAFPWARLGRRSVNRAKRNMGCRFSHDAHVHHPRCFKLHSWHFLRALLRVCHMCWLNASSDFQQLQVLHSWVSLQLTQIRLSALGSLCHFSTKAAFGSQHRHETHCHGWPAASCAATHSLQVLAPSSWFHCPAVCAARSLRS